MGGSGAAPEDLSMNFPHFVRIDQDGRGGARHFVIHTRDPKFTLELAPDGEAPDRIGRGVIKRLCVPNSWAGDYGQCSRLLAAAQDFFVESGAGGEAGPRVKAPG